jgi:branched-chain amino acid transport system ATP-binding protein
MSVFENLQMGAYTRGATRIADDIDKVLELFPVLGLRKNQLAGTLSGGEQEMLAIARALMARPKLCIFDEPSLGLAPKIVVEVARTLAEIKTLGITILLVEQNSAMALRLADRAYVYEAGTIRLEGTGEELLSNQEVKRAYLSS